MIFFEGAKEDMLINNMMVYLRQLTTQTDNLMYPSLFTNPLGVVLLDLTTIRKVFRYPKTLDMCRVQKGLNIYTPQQLTTTEKTEKKKKNHHFWMHNYYKRL